MTNSDSYSTSLSTSADTDIGRVVQDMGLATKTEIEFCREQQKQSSDPNQRSLADLLVEHNFITANQAKRLRGTIEDRRNSQIPGYQLISRVGKGAMATVYKARQLSMDRIVAIKVLPKRMSANQEFVERFYKEGKAAARLSHNNIVQGIDVGCSPDGYHYFVMEFVEGKTLYDVMQPPPIGEGRTFSEAEALNITIQIAEALEHAHKRGLIHRDVKPKNIMLTPTGVAKLTDLGLARDTDDKQAAESEAGKAYGTPYYISPEQVRGDMDIDFRADIYSLGATMYHLVTGHPPFEGDTPSAVMHKHLKQPLTPPDHINTSLSAGIGEIVEVAMAKKREDRYSSMHEMLEDLRAVAQHQAPVFARRTVDLDSLAKLADSTESDKTMDISQEEQHQIVEPFFLPINRKTLVTVLSFLGASIFINIVLLLLYLLKN